MWYVVLWPKVLLLVVVVLDDRSWPLLNHDLTGKNTAVSLLFLLLLFLLLLLGVPHRLNCPTDSRVTFKMIVFYLWMVQTSKYPTMVGSFIRTSIDLVPVSGMKWVSVF